MFRRLHLDEAQRASLIRAPQQQGQDQENPEQSELALEFSRLLEQVQGPIAAAHDEVMALGLALAQAIPTVQQVRLEVESPGDNEQEFQQEMDSDVALEDRGEDVGWRSQAAAVSVERQQAACGAEGPQRDEQACPDEQGDGDAQVAAGQTESVLEEDLAMAIDLINLESDEAAGSEAGDAVKLPWDSLEEGDEASQDKGALIDFLEGFRRINDRNGPSDGESEGDISEEGEYATSADVMDNSSDAMRVERELQSGQGGTEAESAVAQAFAQVVPEESSGVERSPKERFQASSAGESEAVTGRTARQIEQLSKALHSAGAVVDQDAQQGAPGTGRAPLASPDQAFQLMLLRQAFESFRPLRAELSEPKARAGMPAVTTALGTAEARSARHDTAPKAVRHLDRNAASRMLERVETALKEAARSRDGKTLSLRLDPADLGKVKVDVTIREGSLHARITPENQQVLSSLRENAHELQSALRRLGLSVDSVSVTVTAEASPDTSDFGRELADGKSYQEQRNNMPADDRQVAENTVGNELAQWKEAVAPEQGVGVVDHWVA